MIQDLSQGDIIKIAGFQSLFMIVSKNAFIKASHMFHVCPILENIPDGPLHISINGIKGTTGCVICEQIKLIDPSVRSCNRKDRVSYGSLIDISDALQGIFEYD